MCEKALQFPPSANNHPCRINFLMLRIKNYRRILRKFHGKKIVRSGQEKQQWSERLASVSRHHGGPFEGHPEIPRISLHYRIKGLREGSELGFNYDERSRRIMGYFIQFWPNPFFGCMIEKIYGILSINFAPCIFSDFHFYINFIFNSRCFSTPFSFELKVL